MCFDVDSAPPIPAIAGAAVSHEDLTLRSADGTELAAFAAIPDAPNGSGVVILPDVRGLYRFYEELALRFAERGFAAVAIDYFGRTAGVAKRSNDWDFWPHMDQTTPEQIRDDTAAAVAHLRDAGAQRVFAVGFCFGGRMAWLAAADGHGLAGAVGFYGKPGVRNGQPGPVQRAGDIEAPVLALMAGDDQGIPPGGDRRAGARVRGRGRRARGRDLRRRPAFVLRPQAGGVRRRLRGRLAAHARLPREPRVLTSGLTPRPRAADDPGVCSVC